MDRSFTFVVNPTAGRGRTSRLLPHLTDALSTSGLDYEFRVSTHPEEPVDIAHDALDRERTVVAVGGDGLVGQLAGTVADREGILGIVPTGAGNDFARHLGYEVRHPLAALEVLARGDVHRVDLGRVGERWFCCVAGTGFDAAANQWANGIGWLSGTPLYVAAVLRTLVSYRPRPFRLVVDGVEHSVEAWLLAVANGPNYGGGMRVAPDARTDDGLLHVTVVGPVSRPGFLRQFPRVFRGNHLRHPDVHTLVGREVHLDALDPGLHVYADGEDFGPLPVTVTVGPDALQVVVPAR